MTHTDETFPKRWTEELNPDILSFEKCIIPALLEIGQISEQGYTADPDDAKRVHEVAQTIN